jgi:hypothetical protein
VKLIDDDISLKIIQIRGIHFEDSFFFVCRERFFKSEIWWGPDLNGDASDSIE